MPLKGDERALLQLVCERGQSYEDIAGLLGTDTGSVRLKARQALASLGGTDPDAEVGLTDYLLGQSDPIGRADAIRFIQQDPPTYELAQRLEQTLRELAPAAKLPTLPEPRGKRRRAALPAAGEQFETQPTQATQPAAAGATAADPATTRSRGLPRVPPGQSRMIALLSALAVILLVVILVVAGVFSSEDPDSTAASPTATTATDGDATGENITSVPLEATDGSGVAGSADFGLVSNQQLYVDLDLQGLDPKPEEGTTYLLWLMIGDVAGYPISSPLEPDENGNFSGRLAVPTAVALSVGGQAKSVKVSASPIDELRQAIKRAAQDQAPILNFIGTELAAGEIPLAAPGKG